MPFLQLKAEPEQHGVGFNCMFVCMYVGVSYLGRTLPPATSLLAAAEVPLKRASSSAMGSSARNVLALQSITFHNTYILFSTRNSYHLDIVHIHTVHTWIGVYLHAWAYIYIHIHTYIPYRFRSARPHTWRAPPHIGSCAYAWTTNFPRNRSECSPTLQTG